VGVTGVEIVGRLTGVEVVPPCAVLVALSLILFALLPRCCGVEQPAAKGTRPTMPAITHVTSRLLGLLGSTTRLSISTGGIFVFGDAPFDESVAGPGITNAIGIAGIGPPTLQASLGVPALRIATQHRLIRS